MRARSGHVERVKKTVALTGESESRPDLTTSSNSNNLQVQKDQQSDASAVGKSLEKTRKMIEDYSKPYNSQGVRTQNARSQDLVTALRKLSEDERDDESKLVTIIGDVQKAFVRELLYQYEMMGKRKGEAFNAVRGDSLKIIAMLEGLHAISPDAFNKAARDENNKVKDMNGSYHDTENMTIIEAIRLLRKNVGEDAKEEYKGLIKIMDEVTKPMDEAIKAYATKSRESTAEKLIGRLLIQHFTKDSMTKEMTKPNGMLIQHYEKNETAFRNALLDPNNKVNGKELSAAMNDFLDLCSSDDKKSKLYEILRDILPPKPTESNRGKPVSAQTIELQGDQSVKIKGRFDLTASLRRAISNTAPIPTTINSRPLPSFTTRSKESSAGPMTAKEIESELRKYGIDRKKSDYVTAVQQAVSVAVLSEKGGQSKIIGELLKGFVETPSKRDDKAMTDLLIKLHDRNPQHFYDAVVDQNITVTVKTGNKNDASTSVTLLEGLEKKNQSPETELGKFLTKVVEEGNKRSNQNSQEYK